MTDTDHATPEPLPQRFGRYRIVQRLATGGMAEILLARSTSLGGLARTCVIKRVLPSFSADALFVNLFIDEARISIHLKHPNIVRLQEFGQHDGVYYMVMDYVDGTDLAALMEALAARGQRLELDEILYIIREICTGLQYAHTCADSRGQALEIVHRDISPHNVLIDRRGLVKLTDFGIAAARNKITATQPGTLMGKSPYMAPEQAAGGKVDHRADLWATGVILYELLTGQRLFAGDNVVASIFKVLNDPIPAPSTWRTELDAELDRICLHALQRDRALRVSSAAELGTAIKRCGWPLDGGQQRLAQRIVDMDWSQTTTPLRPSLRSDPEPVTTQPHADLAQIQDAQVAALLDHLRDEPNLWELVSIADRCRAIDLRAQALVCARCAALVFAHRGLLLQAIAAHHAARQDLSAGEVRQDLLTLAELEPGNTAELEQALDQIGGLALWHWLESIEPRGLGHNQSTENLQLDPTPLLSDLGPREFADLAWRVKVRHIAAGQIVLREGDHSELLLATARGRLVVHARPALSDTEDSALCAARSRMYVGALSEGDFFGEFSFLTHRPRSATVETITDCIILEFPRSLIDDVIANDPLQRDALLRFYKTRVVELLMAKSPLFALLSSPQRRQLLERSDLVEAPDGAVLIQEGDASDAFYYIKSGEAEVFMRDEAGLPIFVNKLCTGDFFGEVAALRAVPRTVNVRAMGELVLLRVQSQDLRQMLRQRPQLAEMFDRIIEQRDMQLGDKLSEHARLLCLI